MNRHLLSDALGNNRINVPKSLFVVSPDCGGEGPRTGVTVDLTHDKRVHRALRDVRKRRVKTVLPEPQGRRPIYGIPYHGIGNREHRLSDVGVHAVRDLLRLSLHLLIELLVVDAHRLTGVRVLQRVGRDVILDVLGPFFIELLYVDLVLLGD